MYALTANSRAKELLEEARKLGDWQRLETLAHRYPLTPAGNEALKLLLGIGEPLVGRFLLFDALDTSFREVKLHRDPKCPACGDNPTITEYIDYEGFCASPQEWLREHTTIASPAD